MTTTFAFDLRQTVRSQLDGFEGTVQALVVDEDETRRLVVRGKDPLGKVREELLREDEVAAV